MITHIRDSFTQHLPIQITPSLATQLIRMVTTFELRDEHPLTLNSQMFGVYKFIFNSTDRKNFFDIIGYDEQFIVGLIAKIPSVNKEFKVVSDAFNLTSVYMVYLLLNSKISTNLKHDAIIAILNYMQYRIISSAVNHYFPHSVNHEIMQTVVESLSMKFAIRQFGSWTKVVTERSESMAFDTKAHQGTLNKFDNDKLILYLISDTSTRIRSQLKIITSNYYEMKDANTFITSHSSTASVDGEKVLREQHSIFESMGDAIFNKIVIKTSFIDERFISMVQKTVPRINVSIIRRMLSVLSDEARHQMETGTTRDTRIKKNKTEIYVGIIDLLDHMIHVIYSSAIHNPRININSKIAIYTNTKNVFTAARTANQELINVRASIDDLFRRTRLTTRESTISGLGIVLALYITLLSFSSL